MNPTSKTLQKTSTFDKNSNTSPIHFLQQKKPIWSSSLLQNKEQTASTTHTPSTKRSNLLLWTHWTTPHAAYINPSPSSPEEVNNNDKPTTTLHPTALLWTDKTTNTTEEVPMNHATYIQRILPILQAHNLIREDEIEYYQQYLMEA